jgi:hypothetical protein
MVNPKSPEDELLRRSEEWFRDIVPDKVTRNLSRRARVDVLAPFRPTVCLHTVECSALRCAFA